MDILLDVSGRPNTRDGKALEALKLLTENVSWEPQNGVMGTPVCLELIITAKSNHLC